MKKAVLMLLITLIVSCSKTDEPAAVTAPVQKQPAVEAQAPVVPAKTVSSEKPEPIELDFEVQSIPGSPEAHKKYLDDPTLFQELNIPKYTESAVIGSNLSVLYPGFLPATTADLDSHPEGIPLDKGTHLQLLGKIENSDKEYYGLFKFQDNYNYFYKVEIDGQEGAVFGADLAGIGESAVTNSIIAELYSEESNNEMFPPYIGLDSLPPEVQTRLETDRIAFQRVTPSEYRLSLDRPDDMLALYIQDAGNKQIPLFLTTDLYANSLHLYFDKYLQFIEENFLVPRLKQLNTEFLGALQEKSSAPVSGAVYSRALERAIAYFQVSDALLSIAPVKKVEEDKYGRTETLYEMPDMDEVLAGYPESVVAELKLIRAAEGTTVSPNFGYKEDYSQYKARGHYTKNGILEAYFRAMMWYGRIHSYISAGKILPYSLDGEPVPQETAEEISVRHFPMVAVLTELVEENQDTLLSAWKELFDPITTLIGMNDDLSFYDLLPFYEELEISDLSLWLEDTSNIVSSVNKAHSELRPPVISGNSVFAAPSEDYENPPMGWRLFGQRFTWDSYIHQFVSPPRYMPRDIVRGLDITRAFGSTTADYLLGQSDYPVMPGLDKLLASIAARVTAMEPDIWTETYYNQVLYQIKTQAVFEPGSGFYFTESPQWGIKSQLAAHGTWAALRHDTILYVKQVYAERAGDGDYSPTYRTDPLPQPVHYIEPNLAFLRGALNSILKLKMIAHNYQLQDEEFLSRSQELEQILTRSIKIGEQEYNDSPLSTADLQWIRTVPKQLSKLVVPPGANYSMFSDDPDSLRGAIVADVYTNMELGLALETATGIPHRLYIALNDGQGGKRIAQGYGFSYYEFTVPYNKRLTNEEWRSEVYREDADLSGHLPFWMEGVALNPR